MNYYPNIISDYIGASGTHNITDYIDNRSNSLFDYTNNNVSNLSYQLYDFNKYINLLPIIFKDKTTGSTVLKITETNGEIKFDTIVGNQVYTKIDKDGIFNVYHNLDITLPSRSEGWWNVEEELTTLMRDGIGLRFDITENQALDAIQTTQIEANTTAITQLTTGLGVLTSTTIPSIVANVSALQLNKQDNISVQNPLNFLNNSISLQYDNDTIITNNLNKLIVNSNLNLTQSLTIKNKKVQSAVVYPPTIWNSRSLEFNTTLNGRSCIGINLYLTTASYGCGTYNIWYSTAYNVINTGSYQPYMMFDKGTTYITAGLFATNYSPFSSGLYLGNNYLCDSSYLGEWICIQLPNPIISTSYKIYCYQNAQQSPRDFRFYGSMNGINWIQLDNVNLSVFTSVITRTLNNTNIYSYYCLTINRVFPSTGSPYSPLGINEFEILGIDEPIEFLINSSTLNKDTRLQLVDTNSGTSIYDGFLISKHYNNDCSIMNNENNNLIFGTNQTERLRITNTGNIGIGITNPSYKLDVVGGINVSSGNDIFRNGVSLTTTSNQLFIDSSNYTYNVSQNLVNYNNLNNKPFTNTGTNIINANTGNIALGVVPNINSFLKIVKGTAGDAGANNGDNSVVYIEQTTAWTAAQQWALFVKGYSYLNGLRVSGTETQRTIFKIGGQLGLATNDGSAITFSQTSTQEKMRIHTNGFVGINRAAPSTQLDVSGTITTNNQVNIIEDGITTTVFDKRLNIVSTNANIKLFRIGGSPTIEFMYKATAPLNNTDYVYFWDTYIGNTASTFNIRERFPNNSDRLIIASLYNHFVGATNRYTYFNDETVERNSYNHTTSPVSIFNRTATSTTVLDQQPMLHLSREGTAAQALGARATFTLGRWENNSTNSRSRLNINLSHNAYTDDVSVLTLRSDGRVGINNTNPISALDIGTGNITTTGNLNIIQSSTITSTLLTRKINIVDFDATIRLFRIASNPILEFLFKSSTPTSATDYTYYWQIYSGITESCLTIAEKFPNDLERFKVAADYNHFIGATNRYTYFNNETTQKNGYDHTSSPVSIFNRIPMTSAIEQKNLLTLSREGTSAVSYGARATFTLGKYENSGTNSRTKLELNLAHNSYNDNQAVMTWNSSGFVGINNSTPNEILDIGGNFKATGTITGGACSLTSLNLNNGNITNGGAISCTSLNLNNGAITNGGAITGTSASLTGSLNMNGNNIHSVYSITATSISGTITGNVSGNITGNLYGTADYAKQLTNNPSISVSGVNVNGGNINSVNTITTSTISSSGLTISSSANYIYGGTYCYNQWEFAESCFFYGYNAVGTNYSASFGGLYDNTDYWKNSELFGALGWGGGNNSTVVVKGISGSLHLYSIKCNYGVLAKGFMCYSDIRIKRDIKDFEALPILEKIQPKNYNLIETGTNTYGYIAQDVNEVCPNLVSNTTDFVPNIFEIGNINEEGIVNFPNRKNIELKVNDKIKINDKGKYVKGNEFNIIEIIDNNNFKININFEPKIMIGEVFIFGIKVDDYKSIDYNQMTALNTQGIRELNNKIKLLEEKINQLLINNN